MDKIYLIIILQIKRNHHSPKQGIFLTIYLTVYQSIKSLESNNLIRILLAYKIVSRKIY